MNTQNIKLFIISCFFILATGCSTQTSIKSVSEDQVVVRAEPDKFSDAYTLAQKECQKTTRNAEYVTDGHPELNFVVFNCIGEAVEIITEEEASETQSEPEEIAEVETEIAPEETTPEENQ